MFLLVLLEVTCRAFWAFSGVPFLSCPNRLYRFFYPELRAVEAETIRRGDATFDVLLLGGSVLDPRFEDIGGKLERRLGPEARVHCVARPAHTSRDSMFKYRRLGDKRFDLVIFYHGINEARANNCPPELFRADYSHWGWYRLVNAAEDGGPRTFVLPYTLGFVWTKIGGKLGLLDLVPKHAPGPARVRYGSDIKTDVAFRANVAAIRDIARARGDPLVLMTFATYVAPGYTRRAFEALELDYARPGLPIELWGAPAAVAKAVAAHNAVLRDLARGSPRVYLVDQARLMPPDGKLFNDVCHLSAAGSVRFVDNLVRGLAEQGLGTK